MTDTVVDLNFNSVPITSLGGGPAVGTVSGRIQVDYTTGTATPLNNLAVTPNGGSPIPISTLTLQTIPGSSGSPPVYSISAGSISQPDSNHIVTVGSGGFFDVVYPTANQLPPNVTVLAATPGAQLDISTTPPPTVLSGTIADNAAAPANPIAVSGSPVTCFTSGTRIRTPRGEVAVEELKVGDLVVTSSGSSRPIVWLGHREIRCASRENPREAWPIRVSAGAFGEGKPERDLYLSPGRAVCVDCVGEVFIPVDKLVNGATITREVRETIDYWHLELEGHDVLFAEGLKAESYINVGNRLFFAGDLAAVPDAVHGLEDYCRPFVDGGPIVQAVRAALELRAEALGYSRIAASDFRLVVDGAVQPPLAAGNAAVFLLPKDASDVRLVTKTFVPADDRGYSSDARALGLCLYGISFSDGESMIRVGRDDPRLDAGCHDVEASLRWTKAELRLDPSLWNELKCEQILLRVDHDAGTMRGWTASSCDNTQALPAPLGKLRLIA